MSEIYTRGINLIKNSVYYYLYNAHGDVVQLTDGNGAVTKDYHYDAFGVEIGKDETDANPWRYCGEYWDEETGTVYLRARSYSPGTGRFLIQDSLEYMNPNDPLSLNLYSYCQNNPLLFIDPNGTNPRLFYFYGEDQKSHAESNMKDLNTDYEVKSYLITSIQDFTDAWNDMYNLVGDDDIDVVIVNLHGNPTYVEFMDLNKLDFTKNIDTFVLLSCNAGHQRNGADNFAQQILDASNNNINQLIAADGTHFRGIFWHPFRGIEVKGDKTWKDYYSSLLTQNLPSMGFVRYKWNGKNYELTSIGPKFNSVKSLLKKVGA